MFEFSIALKYLIPRKKHLSVTLIAMMSVGVISLIVWLLLVFLSITSGIESNWLKKLTDLNAPVRVTPTSAYFSSYYHKVDSVSSASNFTFKTLGEKKDAILSDPYDPEEDPEVPSQWEKPAVDSKGALIDPVKGLVSAFSTLRNSHPGLFYQDYEMSGALLKLQLLRNHSPSLFSAGQESMNFLTQVSYLATPPTQKQRLSSLLLPLSSKDINHLLFLANYRMERVLEDGVPSLYPSSDSFQTKLNKVLPFVQIHTLKTVPSQWKLPASLLPENVSFAVTGPLEHLMLSSSKKATGSLVRKGHEIVVYFGKSSFTGNLDLPLFAEDSLTFQASIQEKSVETARHMQDILVDVQGTIQGKAIKGSLPWKDLLVDTFSEKPSKASPPWAHLNAASEWVLPSTSDGGSGILLPKSFQENGVLLGDKGFLSYQGSTSSSVQEQRVPVFVAGFYDPGVISIGNKCLLVPKTITKTINSSNSPFTFDKISLGGFQVWPDSPHQAKQVKQEIKKALEAQGISKYWNVSSYQDYDFAKDLLQQFQSDKMLLSLIGVIILVVACCNIISFLVLLVSDKKKEIAILQAMGASKQSIALIFGSCGVIVGLLGCAIGTFGALITLKNIDALTSLLSALQGHEAFNPAFYGNSLSSTLSSDALLFIFIATPTLSLLSGLIPAIKASRLCPSSVLRSES